MSIAGGVDRAIDRAEELGCTAMQIFVKQSRKLFDRPLKEEVVDAWHEKLSDARYLRPEGIIAHSGYLINIASPEDEKWARYVDALEAELRRCDQLGIEHLVLHPGSPKKLGVDWGIDRIIQGLDRVYSKEDIKANVALEVTAGTGGNIGYRFEHLKRIMEGARYPEKLRVVFDTCHAYAAGYKFDTPEDYEAMWEEFDRIIGLDNLVGIHVNDSKNPFDSHKDRHDHIGYGHMGTEPFRLLLADSRFTKIPLVLETPKEDDWDRTNLRLLWQLSGEEPPEPLR